MCSFFKLGCGHIDSQISRGRQSGELQTHSHRHTASEAVNLLNKKSVGGNIAIKIDTRKAFGTLDWGFLFKVLEALGFHPIFYSWIHTLLILLVTLSAREE